MTEEQQLEFESAIRFGIESAIDHGLVRGWFTAAEADMLAFRVLRRFLNRYWKPEWEETP